MQKLIILFVLAFTACTQTDKPSLVGTWKLTKASYQSDQEKSLRPIYDRFSSDLIKKKLLEEFLLQKTDDSELIDFDTAQFKQELDQTFLNYNLARLTLRQDQSFYMQSFGLITPSTIPGLHLGDTLEGKWIIKDANILELTVGDKTASHSFYYKIKYSKANNLIVTQTDPAYEFPYNEIEFVRE